MKYETYYKVYLNAIEKTLETLLPPANRQPAVLHEAVRYSVFPGGKRFRPVLALAACEATGGKYEEALYAGAACELIHCYSLVHDDLPALDNDEMRRGKLTCHKKYGEAIGVLVGDALLTLAFQVLSKVTPAEKAAKLVRELSTEAGSYGMIGGQVADLEALGKDPDVATLDYISIHKTGKLIKAGAVMGAISAGASQEICSRMMRYGELLGMAFQSVDDLLDGDGYMHLMKPKELKDKIRDLIAKAKREIKPLGKKADKLHKLADFLVERIPRSKHVQVDR